MNINSNFIFYLLIVFEVFIFPTFRISPTYASEMVESNQVIDFNKDLTFIQKTLLENHPGVCNTLDPKFLEEMEKSFKIAKQKLFDTNTIEEKAKILREVGRGFCDAHLWICYNLNKPERPIASRERRPFSIQELKKGTYWINIPTFRPSKDQIKSLNQIIESLAEFRKQTVIFDLRGNGGGNSCWGEELLKALFGEEYTNQQLAKFNQNVYSEWRISQGNLDHIQELIPIVKKQFGENHLAVQLIKNTYKGMQDAFLRGENYYSELSDLDALSSNAVSSFSGRIVAIIDKSCASSCLSFIDGLKAMNADIIFIGESTGMDTVYTELRRVTLPSGKGTLGFPIKVKRNHPRGHNVPYMPDIQYSDLQNTTELQNFVLTSFLKIN
ncbi:MAG: S41 family peptidase [Candidatus Rhabdochlamydia sp.]